MKQRSQPDNLRDVILSHREILENPSIDDLRRRQFMESLQELERDYSSRQKIASELTKLQSDASRRIRCDNQFDIKARVIGRRSSFGGVFGQLGSPMGFNAIPANPLFVDVWALRRPDDATLFPTRLVIGSSVYDQPYRIGILADIHQNTRLLQQMLEMFRAMGVNAIFALGDYCFTKSPDSTGVRAQQVDKVLSLIGLWLDEHSSREAVILLGNHELEEHYYESPYVHQLVRDVIGKWKNKKSMLFADDPFRGFEVDNAIEVFVYFDECIRKFRLSHAITKEFVVSLYMGLDATAIDNAKDRILSTLGYTWLKRQSRISKVVQNRWRKFLESMPTTESRTKVVRSIVRHLRKEMRASAILDALRKVPNNETRENAASYDLLLRMVAGGNKLAAEQFLSIWGPPTLIENEFCSVEFLLDLRRFYSCMGFGQDYSLCGHFHADIGMFQAAAEFGTWMIGVGGFQPDKIISNDFTAYVLECNDSTDVLYRLSANRHVSADT